MSSFNKSTVHLFLIKAAFSQTQQSRGSLNNLNMEMSDTGRQTLLN